MQDFKKIQKDIEALGYKSHGLWTIDGQCLLRHNLAKDASNLPQIIKMLQSLPHGRYIVNCSNGAGKKYAHFDFPVIVEGTAIADNQNASEIVKSPAGHQSEIDAITFGRLQSENEMLKAQLAALEQNDDDDDDDDDEEPEPTLKDKALEAILPVIPTLADKMLALLDRYISPAPLAENKPAEPQQIQLSPEAVQQIAQVVKNMVMQDLTQISEDGGY